LQQSNLSTDDFIVISSRNVQVSGRLHDDPIPACEQQASGKRQGTKSREVGHRTVQVRLWGFSCGDEVFVAALPS
jgi:hypothetical protein